MRVGNFRELMTTASDSIFSVLVYDVMNLSMQVSFDGVERGSFSNFTNWSRKSTFLGINVTSGGSLHDFYQIQDSSMVDNATMSINIYGRVGYLKFFVDWDCHDPTDWIEMDEVDVAVLKLSSNLSYPVEYSEVSGDCYECAAYPLGDIYPGQTLFFGVDTKFPYNLYLHDKAANASLWSNHTYSDHGRYFLRIVEDSNHTLLIDIHEDHKGVNPYLPILYAAILFTGIALVYTAIKFLQWRYKITHKVRAALFAENKFEKDFGNPPSIGSSINGANASMRQSLIESKSEQQPPPAAAEGERAPLISRKNANKSGTSSVSPGEFAKKKRLQSLDTFRGMSLVIMIFVNYGGGGYWFFNHSRWNGLTVADLVFPWFVWIMGVSIVYSFKSRHSDPLLSQLYQVVRRTIILFALGLFLTQSSDLSKLRIPGVLQRFSISYFVVALTELLTTRFVYQKKRLRRKFFNQVRDLTNNWVQWIVTLCLVVLWLLLTFLLPLDSLDTPGVKCPTGYLGPGGLDEYGRYSSCTGGAAKVIDQWLFGLPHIYHNPTCKNVYHCQAHDPEGLLGSLTSIAMCFLGLQCGKILKHFRSHKHRIPRMLIWGFVLCLIGAALCEFKKDGGVMPLNKNLWSLSFILVMAGTGSIVLTLFYVLIDVANIWTGAPFIFPGMNSIFVYVGSEMVRGFPFFWDGPHTHLVQLSENLIAVTLWILVSYYCYRIGFFVKI